jgi:ankyrin repeat protein
VLTVSRDALFDPELVRWLVEHGADPNARCRYDITPLSIAVGYALRDVILLLFELGASIQYGQALHCAVRASREDEIIELLLQKGASPNAIMF